MFLGRAKTPDIEDPNNPGQTIPGPDRIFLEGDADRVVRSLASRDQTKYFLIDISRPSTALQPVTLKSGPRAPGRDLDIAEIIAGGATVGSAEVER